MRRAAVSPELEHAGPSPPVDDPKDVVRRLIEEVVNGGNLTVIDEIYSARTARSAHRWITPFRESFPDVHMEIVELIAEGEKVVGRFRCSGTHRGPWRGHLATGRRFERVDEVYVFRIVDDRTTEAWGIEDTRSRERQLGLSQETGFRATDDRQRSSASSIRWRASTRTASVPMPRPCRAGSR